MLTHTHTLRQLHNGEGLTTFNLHGLMNPVERNFDNRVRSFARMYMGRDPQLGAAQNYDVEHKLIKSLLNGSRGPMLRKVPAATVDPVICPSPCSHFERCFNMKEERVSVV